MGLKVVKPCCDPMKFRIQHFIETNGDSGIGIHKDSYTLWYDGYIALAEVKYCPWCGKQIDICESRDD